MLELASASIRMDAARAKRIGESALSRYRKGQLPAGHETRGTPAVRRRGSRPESLGVVGPDGATELNS